MNTGNKFNIAIRTLVAVFMAAILAAACGSGVDTSGFSQTYTTSAGAGEVLQFSVDTTNLTYAYKVIGSSYNVTVGQTGTGSLAGIPGGTYTVGPSNDGFITSGKVFPLQSGLIVGDVVITSIDSTGTYKIPVFGFSNPITTLAGLAGNYNFEGFGCATPSHGNVASAACLAHHGTITIGSGSITDSFTRCKSGNAVIDTSASGVACSGTNQTGTISASTTYPGVFDVYDNGSTHIGWLFAFTALNGQTVAVIDHDDPAGEYGHTVLTTYAGTVPGASDGHYFVKNNEGGEHLVSISGTSVYSTIFPSGAFGTLTYNSPWPGMTTYQLTASGFSDSGIAMLAGTGAYTHTDDSYPALFAVGVRY